MALTISLLTTLALGFISIVLCGQCPLESPIGLPSNLTDYDLTDFVYAESGLQVFTHLNVPCDGQLTEWKYYSNLTIFNSITFGVFRKRPNTNPYYPVWDIVGKTPIKVPPPGWDKSIWVTAAVQPINVKQGDYLGFFYDTFMIDRDRVLIPNRGGLGLQNAETYVYLQDSTTVGNNILRGLFEIRQRVPAFGATITRLTPTTPATSTMRRRTTRATTTLSPEEELMVHLTIIGRGQSVCSSRATTSSVVTFEDAQSCMQFAGDNRQQCNGDRFGFCIDSRANCASTNTTRGMIYQRDSDCFANSDQLFSSCVHLNENDEKYCSTIIEDSESCHTNNAFCLSAVLTPPDNSAGKAYLNLNDRGRTYCSRKNNTATIRAFFNINNCELYRGQNLKVCDGSGGLFSACIDVSSDCSIIGATEGKRFETPEDCYDFVDDTANTCAHFDANGKRFCSTYLNETLSCYRNDSACRNKLSPINISGKLG